MRFRSRPDARGFQAAAPKMVRRLFWFSGAPCTLAVCLGTALCGGALLVGPLHAAPVMGADENGPQVQILSPGYNDVIKGKFDIKIAVGAGNYNPASIEMFVDEKSATGGAIPLQNLGTSFAWDTRQFIDGPHKLTVRVTDTQGFRGWAEVNIFINNNRVVDDIAPTLAWRNVQKDMMLSGRAQIQLDANDFFGVKLIKITINSAQNPDKNPALATWLLNRPPYVVNFDTTRVPDGTYYLRANAWDASDQQGIAPSLRIGVLNNAINAQTLGEQLAGFQALEEAVESQNKPKVKTLPQPLGQDPKVADFNVPLLKRPRTGGEYTPGSGNLAASEKQRQGALNKLGETPTVKTPVASRPLTPSTPSLQTRPIPGAGRIANSKSKSSNGQLSPQKSFQIAEAEKPQNLIESIGVLSSAKLPELTASRELLALVRPETEGYFAARPGAPMLSERDVAPVGEATLSGASAPRLAFARGIEAEVAPETGREFSTKIATPRAETRFFSEGAMLSAPVSGTESVATIGLTTSTLVAATADTAGIELPTPDSLVVGLSTPPVVIERKQVGAISPSKIADPRKVVSVGRATPSSKNPVKTPKTAKVQVAALPRSEKLGATQMAPAITVAPIQATVSDAPTSHRVERTTTLRAVAARYGFPVELVAACNNWPVEMNVVKGMVVELPRPLQVSLAGQPISGDSHSMLVGGTGVTAFRFLFEQAGGKIEWDAKNKRVVARKGQSEITLSIGSKVAKVGDKDVMMELAAFLFEGRTMVPVRLFEEGLRAQVEWDPQTGRMVVAMLADANSQG